MNQPVKSALLGAAALLLATGAYAQHPNAAPQAKANAADKAQRAGGNAGGKPTDNEHAKRHDGHRHDGHRHDGHRHDGHRHDGHRHDGHRHDDKAPSKGEGKGGPDRGKAESERASRRAKEREAQRAKLTSMLKGPMTAALKQELRRHAERLARLERVKTVAEAESDTTTAEKAAALIAKENERHEKWMSKHASGAEPAGAAPGATTPARGDSDKEEAK